MKKTMLAVVLASLMVLGACSKVPAGNVGIKVYLLGGAKGVDTETLGPGRYWLGWNEDLFLFPTFTQNSVWTKDVREGSPNDESFSFQTKQGLVVNADIGISYAIDPVKVPAVFQKYRKGVNEITDIYLRNMVRDALVEYSSNLDIESVYGNGKTELMNHVESAVRAQVGGIGIIVEKIYWIGELRLPDTVVASINAKIGATQKSQQRENEIQQAIAEAAIKIEEARGEAESVRLKAEIQAKANRLLADSLSETLIKYKAIEKWDGKLPATMAGDGSSFLLQLPK